MEKSTEVDFTSMPRAGWGILGMDIHGYAMRCHRMKWYPWHPVHHGPCHDCTIVHCTLYTVQLQKDYEGKEKSLGEKVARIN